VYFLRLSDPEALDSLCDFLCRVHVVARPAPDGTVDTSIAGAASPLHELREISGYVTTWNALNPHSVVELAGHEDE
jgi:hypothetical protein